MRTATAIWEAAEPILASNPDFLCRMASTGNGRHNLFYRMTEGEIRGREDRGVAKSEGEWKRKSRKRERMLDADGAAGERGRRRSGKRLHPALSASDGAREKNDAESMRSRILRSRAGYAVSRITRTEAHGMGVKIYDANTREAVTPEEARAQALDKRAYDQNYECVFADENATLLSHELINAAETGGCGGDL